MRKTMVVLLAILLMLPTMAAAKSYTKDPMVDEILSMSQGVTKEELAGEISRAAKAMNKSEKEIAKQIYAELSASLAASQAETNFTLSSGGGTQYALATSAKGNIYYEPAGTFGVQHGHVGMYYSSSYLVESIPSTGVRSLALSNKRVDRGAAIIEVRSTYASSTAKANAANWAWGRIGEKYSYNFFNNRSTSCVGDKNCSKLVWCAYLNYTDLDSNGGLGVYPTDILNSPKVTRLRTY